MYNFFDLAAKTSQGLHLLNNTALQRIQRNLLNFSQKMFNSNFFRLSSNNLRLDMEEWFINRSSLLINLLLSNESLSWKSKFILNTPSLTLCSTSTTKKIGLSVYFLKISLIWTSCALNESPVVYHPINFSFWLIYISHLIPFSSYRTWLHDTNDPKTRCWTDLDLIRKE